MQSLHLPCPSLPRPDRAAGACQHGFTAIELLVTIAILAVLSALAAPSFTPIMERWRVRQAAEELQSTIYFTRAEAIKRGGGIAIVADSGGWDQGWKVTYTQGSTTTDLQVSPVPSKVAISQSNSKTTLFVDRWGMLSETKGEAPVAMNVLIYPTGKGATDSSATRLCIGTGGRIVQTKQGAACPT
ncbi:MAG: GspH/FimT family pseudopilin [Proteobacteria bacterium]|nr:GspH/FimT family pseudopilin [Pseudomonadota bacterium]